MGRSKNKVRTAIRKCATCGEPFTWTSRNPKKRFCEPVRPAGGASATHRHHHRHPVLDRGVGEYRPYGQYGHGRALCTASTGNTDTIVTTSTANAVTHAYDPYVSGYADRQAPSAAQSCQNCHHPVAVINLLVAPAAAYVNTPSRSVTDQRQPQ